MIKKRTSRKAVGRIKKKLRVRKKIFGTAERPRLTVFRSQKNISAQIVDDTDGKTLFEASSLKLGGKNNKDVAKSVGVELAKKAVAKGVESVIFDRNGYLYHGKVKALADAAREGGLKF